MLEIVLWVKDLCCLSFWKTMNYSTRNFAKMILTFKQPKQRIVLLNMISVWFWEKICEVFPKNTYQDLSEVVESEFAETFLALLFYSLSDKEKELLYKLMQQPTVAETSFSVIFEFFQHSENIPKFVGMLDESCQKDLLKLFSDGNDRVDLSGAIRQEFLSHDFSYKKAILVNEILVLLPREKVRALVGMILAS